MKKRKETIRKLFAYIISAEMLMATILQTAVVVRADDVIEIDRFAEENTIIENGDTENLLGISDDDRSEKLELSQTVAYLSDAVEGEDYVSGIVFKMVDTTEDVEAIEKAYNAELLSCEYGVAVFKLPDDMSVLEAVKLAADDSNDYPVIYPNLISNTIQNDGMKNSVAEYESDIDYNEEPENIVGSEVADGMNEPFLKENVTQYQWHHEAIGSPYAWVNGIKGTNVNVALIAYGINTSHIDAPVNIISSATFNDGGLATDSSNVDVVGYGTAAAGLLAAPENSTLGIGIAPNVNIFNIKTDRSVASIASAIKFAANNNNQVIALVDSFDTPIKELELAVNYAYEKGAIVFAPVGKTGGTYDVYPAAYDNAICVGATDKSNQRAGDYSYSNNVDIAVPGVELWTNDWLNNNLYGCYNGNVLLSSIAAGEAALILEQAANGKVPALLDSNNVLLSGSKKVDALMKLMKASTIKSGAGTGSGIVYIPKALGLTSATGTPKEPVVTHYPITSTTVRVGIKADAFTSRIYYTIDGSRPVYKDGEINGGTRIIYGSASDNEYIDITEVKTDYLTVNAIAVSPSGVVSKPVTYRIPLTEYVDSISIDGPEKVMPGKTANMTATVIPSNSKTKKVKWHVSLNDNEGAAKSAGITIDSSGVLKATSSATPGQYKVWAETVVGGKLSAKHDIYVNLTQNIKTITPVNTKATEYIETSKIIDLMTLFKIEKSNGQPASVGDVYFVSSNPLIADVTGNMANLYKAGNITITAIANDGSGVKGVCKLNVVQKVSGLYINSNGYDKVVAGKSITVVPIILPSTVATKKISSWTVDKNGENNGVTVKNGKISTKLNTAPGNYTITASLIDVDGTKRDCTYNFEVISQSNAVTKITIPKTITVFSKPNNFGAVDYKVMDMVVEGGERNSEGKCVQGLVKVKYSNNRLLDQSFGMLVGQNTGYLFPIKATGIGAGKVKMTVEAMDGSGKKAVCKVNVVNPASSVKVAPSKADICGLTAGKTVKFKAVIGSEYGAVSNKKVEWSVVEGATYATINKNTGALKVNSQTPNYTYIKVRATAKDGCGAYGDFGLFVYKNPGKLEVTDASGVKLIPPKDVGAGYYKEFYVKVPRVDEAYEKVIDGMTYGDFKLSSSNPSVATIRRDKGVSMTSTSSYYLYYFQVLGISKGSSKITISTPDGSQKVSFKIKVPQ